MQKGIIFCTDNELSPKIAEAVQGRIIDIAKAKKMSIVTAALKKRLKFGNVNIVFPTLPRGRLTHFKQMLSALEHSRDDFVFFCEADILYHSSHFDFTPPTRDAYYYNSNNWIVWVSEGVATRVNVNIPLSMLAGDRELLIGHYRRKIAKVEEIVKELKATGRKIINQGVPNNMSGEPGGEWPSLKVDDYPMKVWNSEWPNLDLRHGHNLTKGKRRPEDYNNKSWAKGWRESDFIPGWGKVSDIIQGLTQR